MEKHQIIHRRGGHVAPGMPLCNDAGSLVNPLHQNSAEQTIGTVQMGGPYNVNRLHCDHRNYKSCLIFIP